MDEKVRIVFLGGVGEVTKNMFVYEYWRDGKIADSIIVDCGIGFSDEGDEIIMPDVTYLLNKQETLRAVVLTHGHEDHTSGLSTLLSQIRVPVYGTRLTVALAVGKLAMAGESGVLCLLSDCVRAERDGYTLSEETIEDHLELQVRKAHGKVIFTTMSSNISRIQQAVNVASAFNRKIMFLGRSMRQNVEAAQHLGYLHFPKKSIVHSKSVKKIPSNKLFIIAAGSQAQEDSALSRIADNAHKDISLAPHDMVIFSADPIPGYERQVHKLVNKMTKLGADVVYSDINDELHVSGHGASQDLMLMMGLTRPKYIVPIGGESRQVRQYFLLAEKMGYSDDTLFAPEEKDAIEFTRDGKARIVKEVA